MWEKGGENYYEMMLSVGLPSRPEAVRTAREAIGRLRGRLDESSLEVVRLLVSEIVTNSVRHAPCTRDDDCIELRVIESPDDIRVEVADPGAGFHPDIHEPRAGQTSGWGLFLVDRLAKDWGVSERAPTTVWFEVPRSRASRSASRDLLR